MSLTIYLACRWSTKQAIPLSSRATKARERQEGMTTRGDHTQPAVHVSPHKTHLGALLIPDSSHSTWTPT